VSSIGQLFGVLDEPAVVVLGVIVAVVAFWFQRREKK
jgi:hypothetical protein